MHQKKYTITLDFFLSFIIIIVSIIDIEKGGTKMAVNAQQIDNLVNMLDGYVEKAATI